MDEIFDRLKAIKVNKKYLITSLILTELLGIIVLIWFLRTPLYEKFFIISPKAYSLSDMNPTIRYLITQGDFIEGQAMPETNIIILISEGQEVQLKAKIEPNAENIWNYQISETMQPGIKTLTIGSLDQNNKLQEMKSYKIRIRSRNLLNLTKSISQSETQDELLNITEINDITNASPQEKTIQAPGAIIINKPTPDSN